MLCRSCWAQEARVHFLWATSREVHELALCLACAQDEPLSWLLAWGYSREAPPLSFLPAPQIVRVGSPLLSDRLGPATLVAAGLQQCACGCRIALGAQVPCDHARFAFRAQSVSVGHACHCGRDHLVEVPAVVCLECGAEASRVVVATAQTCLWDEQRRRLIAVDGDLQRGHATWGTFSLHN
ncbi:MAG: hypothetical protein ACLF0G_09570 [Candidatus Brocadiia bacterium]